MSDRIWFWSARHLPRKLVYWAGIVLFGEVSTGPFKDRPPFEIALPEALWAYDFKTDEIRNSGMPNSRHRIFH